MNLSTNQKTLGDLLNQPVESRSEDFDAKLAAAKASVLASHTEVETAALAEPDIRETRETTVDGEEAEIRKLRNAASFGNYLLASGARRGVTGAEAEYNAARGLGEIGFPLEMLMGDTRQAEQRNSLGDVDGGGSQSPWLARLFDQSAASRLGISFREVAEGTANYPILTGGSSPAQRGRTEAASAGTIAASVTELKPTRMTIHSVYSIEDAARIAGYADAIAMDMRNHLNAEVDKAVFLGNSGANENTADITGLNTATSVVEKTITQANKVKGPETLKEFIELVDGQHAVSPADLRVVLAEGAYHLWAQTLMPSPVTSGETIGQFLNRGGINFTVKGGIETNSANNDWGGFVGRAQGLDGAGLVVMWSAGGSSLVTDVYTGAAKGEVSVTLNNLWNVGFVRATSFARIKFVS